MPTAPFAPGSVSIRLYPHNELGQPGAILEELVRQAGLALGGGFDGVMTSEHHGGFAGYMAQPLQMATFVLEEHPGGWVAPAPLLLPLRATSLVAEEVAWLAARHPGRVGLGVAMGALPLDFEVAGIDPKQAAARFKSELPWLTELLRGEDLGSLEDDPALRACREHPVPVLSAAVSVGAARRAANCGAGILMEGMSEPERLRAVALAFDQAGGTGAKVLIRRVWLGQASSELIDAQRAAYDSYTPAGTFGPDQTISAGEPEELVERLLAVVDRTGVDALNLRVQLPDMAPDVVRHQIEALATRVVPLLKQRWPAPAPVATT